MTYYPRFSISADPMPSARPEWIGLQLTTGRWVSATFSCSGVGQGFCYGHPGRIRLIVILAQRETAELVSLGHLRWPPSVGQDWGAIRKTDPRKAKSFWRPRFYPFPKAAAPHPVFGAAPRTVHRRRGLSSFLSPTSDSNPGKR